MSRDFGLRKVRTFLGREAGFGQDYLRALWHTRRKRLVQLERENAALRARLQAGAGGDEASGDGLNSTNVVWIFGSGRTGSTWLSSMMDDMDGQTVWQEPLVGALFGYLYYVRAGHRRGKHFILGDDYKDVWSGPMRDLVLSGAAARFPELAGGGYLIMKEPNGSVGAPLLMEALPESRMILLVRDPRDVVASSMDARKEGNWRAAFDKDRGRVNKLADQNPNAFVKRHASAYLQSVGNAKKAYDSHRGYRVLVRYEDLRRDALEVMKQMYVSLGIKVNKKQLARVVEKHSWENIPKEKKGEGKFYRKATLGGWQEDLTSRQVEIVEEITAPLLNDLYPG